MQQLKLLLWMLLLSGVTWASRISDIDPTSLTDQFWRFLSFRDPAVQLGLAGTTLLGFSCGLLGCFIVLQRLSMMGDTLGHSILPGVVLAFVVTGGQKSTLVLMLGALLAGLAAAGSTWLITRFTPIKEDTAMGVILSAFFAFGVAGLTMLQKAGPGTQSGLDKYLFGQAAALSWQDISYLGLSSLAALVFVRLAFKELKAACFDPLFARSIGLPVDKIQLALMALVTLAIVNSVQAVGVVLVSAMLIIPATTASLWTDRLSSMMALSSLIGILAGWSGMFLSFVGHHLPTGPCIVLVASLLFIISWFFAPRHGQVSLWWRKRQTHTAFPSTAPFQLTNRATAPQAVAS